MLRMRTRRRCRRAARPAPAPLALLDLFDEPLRKCLAHVPLTSHGSFKASCRRLRTLGAHPRYRRERADSGCEERALLVAGGTVTADESWSSAAYVLEASGNWRVRERSLPDPGLRSPRTSAAAAAGDAGCAAVVGRELLVVGPVVTFGLPSSSFMAYDVDASVGINHWSTAGLGYLQTPLPRSNRTRFP